MTAPTSVDQTPPDALTTLWRTGRHVGRTVYAQTGPDATRSDVLIGVMDKPELARAAVDAHNASLTEPTTYCCICGQPAPDGADVCSDECRTTLADRENACAELTEALDDDSFENLVRDVLRTTVYPEPYINALITEARRARADANEHREAAHRNYADTTTARARLAIAERERDDARADLRAVDAVVTTAADGRNPMTLCMKMDSTASRVAGLLATRHGRARTNWVNTAIDHYPECSCDGTCPKCASEMAAELSAVLAVLNTCQYDKNPYQLPLKEGGVAELVATALWGNRGGTDG